MASPIPGTASRADAAIYLSGLETDVLAGWRKRSQREMYRREPEAWVRDFLGYRWHSKQQEIAHNFLNNRRVATKSANGTGKTRQYGELITWGVAVHEPGELLIICSAPGKDQLKMGLFGYVDKNMIRARQRGFELPGYLTDSNQWNMRLPGSMKAKTLVAGRTPPRSDIVGTFQGIRAVADGDVKTWVFIDEGGAVHDDLYVAAEAVTTGAGDNKVAVIGNPDRVGGMFQKIFENKRVSPDWATSTISAYDLPTFTGEVVYPDDPELQRQMLSSGMIDYEWVEQKKRSWGEDSARYKSKVLGEFPDGDDWSFFPMSALNEAENTEIEPGNGAGRILGADYADAEGAGDNSVITLNDGGRIRNHDTWNQGAENLTRTTEAGTATGAEIIVVDRVGVGAATYRALVAAARTWTIVGAAGQGKTPDPTRWANARTYWYDTFREAMLGGEIDLDFMQIDAKGEEVGQRLKDQLLSVRYDFDRFGAIQIEPKKEARKRGVDSPDDLDAAVYAFAVQAKKLVDDPLAGIEPGDTVLVDPWDDLEEHILGMPI